MRRPRGDVRPVPRPRRVVFVRGWATGRNCDAVTCRQAARRSTAPAQKRATTERAAARGVVAEPTYVRIVNPCWSVRTDPLDEVPAERDRQVDFLRDLDPFDARQGYREAGYDSLWRFCLRELSLREGAAGRRIGAMRVLRDFPALEAPLRDGRLSLTTVVTLRPVLAAGNLGDVVGRAAFKTDEETRHLVASLLPRPAPKEGFRRLPEASPEPAMDGLARALGHTRHEPPAFALTAPRPPSRPTLEAVSADQWSMRVTIDAALKGEPGDAEVSPVAQAPRRRPRGGASRGGALRDREARQAPRRGEAGPQTEAGSSCRSSCPWAPAHPRRRQASGLGARRRAVQLRVGRGPPLREPLAARVRSRRAGRARRTLDGRRSAPALQGSQPPSRGEDLRPRAHGEVQARDAAGVTDGDEHYRQR
jgi:hypothetical protein